jgi:hypothetical protein
VCRCADVGQAWNNQLTTDEPPGAGGLRETMQLLRFYRLLMINQSKWSYDL